ncbi:MAG: hypothetical protein ABSB28_04855 [Candidatus Bathyarchaeia archaeon]
MAMQKMVVGTAVAVVVVLMMTSVLALLQSNRTLLTSGTVRTVNVGVYSDPACTQPASSIDWGTINPGTSTVKTVYVKNEGAVTLSLNMTSNTWTPSNCPTYMTLTWNEENASVAVGNHVQADFNLTVLPNITGIGAFSFDIVVTGTG